MMNRTKRPSAARTLAIIFAAIMCITSIGVFSGCTTPDKEVTTPLPSLTPPESAPKVHSVVITYNDAAVSGTLQTNLSAGTLQIKASVSEDSGIAGTLIFESSDKAVATIDGEGNITLKSAGETVISASKNDKYCKFVLVVEEETQAENHTVTVVGGRASQTSVRTGDTVTLTPVIPDHKEFVRWNYDNSDTEITQISGNMFKMPDGDVNVHAEYTDKLYTLRLVGASVSSDGGDSVQKPKSIGYDGDEETPEYEIKEYKYPYDTSLGISAINTPQNKMFVGWDENTVNNRRESTETTISDFSMPDETVTLFANFADIKSKALFADNYDGVSGNWWRFANPPTAFSNGKPSDAASAYDDLEGCSGYTFEFKKNSDAFDVTLRNTSWRGFNLNTFDQYDTQMLKAIFKNRGDKDLTVELYIDHYGNRTSSGEVTIPAGKTVEKRFVANPGFSNDSGGLRLCKKVANTGDNVVPLDIVMSCADMYPKGDRTLSILSTAHGVKMNTGKANGWASGDKMPRFAAAKYYMSLSVHENELTTTSSAGGSLLSFPMAATFELSNVEPYDENDPYLTVYIRIVNNLYYSKAHTYVFALHTQADPRKSGVTVSGGVTAENLSGYIEDGVTLLPLEITGIGETRLIALRIPRSSANEKYYFSLIKYKYDYVKDPNATTGSDHIEGTNNSLNLNMVFTYDNGIGFDPDADLSAGFDGGEL